MLPIEISDIFLVHFLLGLHQKLYTKYVFYVPCSRTLSKHVRSL